MTDVDPYRSTPGATAVGFAAALVAAGSVIAGIALAERTTCDGTSGVSDCPDPLAHPHLTLGLLVIFTGLVLAVLLVTAAAVFREVVITRRLAELAGQGRTPVAPPDAA